MFEKKLQGSGIRPAQFSALAYLMALGPISQSELADRLSITAPTAARLVDRMERDKWVRRRPDADDGRVNRIVGTSKAHGIWDRLSRVVGRQVMAQAYKGVHPSELETVKRVLARVRTNLSV